MSATRATASRVRIALANAGTEARRVGVAVRQWEVEHASTTLGYSAGFKRWNPVRREVETKRLMIFDNAKLEAFLDGMTYAFQLVGESQRPVLDGVLDARADKQRELKQAIRDGDKHRAIELGTQLGMF